ncbi:MAG: tripartite tricarboxylate transporter substrate binding protein [Betaproteobacteria bacterium]|nr:tripartite tricarboxylate transporter substrate binding protein [Betaproteobacteria bacterium]
MTLRALLCTAALAIPCAAFAQAWPSKPVKIVMPSPPASSPDRYTRLLAEKLTQKWGVPVVVENKPGATAMIGTEYVAKQPADGYTLLSTFTSFVQAPILFPNAPYDPEKDFAPLTQTILAEVIMEVRADSPYKTYADLIAAAKAGAKLSYGSFGNGSSFHIYGETVKRSAGIQMTHVPYKGEALILNDLLGGQIDVGFNSIGTALPQIKAGKVRPMAIVSATRSKALPDVPAFPELGVPKLNGGAWFGFFAPAGTPKAVVEKISADVNFFLLQPEMQKWLRDQGLEPTGMTPDQFTQFIKADLAKWRQLITELGIKAND